MVSEPSASSVNVGVWVAIVNDAADEIVGIQLGLLYRANRIENLGELHIYASYSFHKVGNHIDSVMALERGRARLLNQIQHIRFEYMGHLADKHPDLAIEASEIAERLDAFNRLEAGGLTTGLTSGVQDDLIRVNEEWKQIETKIRKIDGFENFGLGPSFDDVKTLASIKPVIYISSNYWTGLALIVTSDGKVSHLELPGLSTIKIREKMSILTKKVFRGYHPIDATDELCGWLWENAMGPLSSMLENQGIHEVFIVPIDILGIMPLHAAWKPDSSQPCGRFYALDHLTISYIPSAKTAVDTLSATKLPFESAMIIEDPLSDLPSAPIETANVIAHFSNAKLIGGEAATREAVLKELNGKNVLHFSCHGYALASDPMESGLIMAHGEPLTVSDIYRSDISDTRIVTLSACESGLIGRRIMDESIGFATAWMGFGVPCVVSTMWSVDDESTSHLIRLFYENMISGGLRPDQALRISQIQLRDGDVPSSDFSNPFYWGAFFVTGF